MTELAREADAVDDDGLEDLLEPLELDRVRVMDGDCDTDPDVGVLDFDDDVGDVLFVVPDEFGLTRLFNPFVALLMVSLATSLTPDNLEIIFVRPGDFGVVSLLVGAFDLEAIGFVSAFDTFLSDGGEAGGDFDAGFGGSDFLLETAVAVAGSAERLISLI